MRQISAETIASVLLISDDDDLAEDLRRVLAQRLPDAFFRAAADTTLADAMLRSFRPDLLVLDLTASAVDARAIGRQVAASPLFLRTRTIKLASEGEDGEQRDGALLSKPITAAALLDAVAAGIAAGAEATKPTTRRPDDVARRLGLTADRYRSLVERFVELMGPKVERLATLVLRPEAEPIRALAHEIKGSALTLGIADVAAPAERIELRARAGMLDGDALAEDAAALATALKHLAAPPEDR